MCAVTTNAHQRWSQSWSAAVDSVRSLHLRLELESIF